MVLLTIEQSNKWLLKPNINPLTGKAIKTDGPTWKALFKACAEGMKRNEHIAYFADGRPDGELADATSVSMADEATVILASNRGLFMVPYGKDKHIMTVEQLKVLLAHVTWRKHSKLQKTMPLSRLDKVLAVCLNNEDPVTFESWDEMSAAEIENVIMLSSETPGKKYCITLDTAFNIYRTAVESGRPERARNPIALDRPFSKEEIQEILTKMKALNPDFVAPAQEVPLLRPGIELVMQDMILPIHGFPLHFVHISVVDSTRPTGRPLINFGTVPGWVETEDIGSADYTSGVLLANLWTLWHQRKFFTKYHPEEAYVKEGCAVAGLISRKPLMPATWFSKRTGEFANQAFIELCQEVNDLVNA